MKSVVFHFTDCVRSLANLLYVGPSNKVMIFPVQSAVLRVMVALSFQQTDWYYHTVYGEPAVPEILYDDVLKIYIFLLQ